MKKGMILLAMLFLTASRCYPQNSATGGGSFSGGGSLASSPSHSVTLTWTASASSGVTGYNIYRSQTNGGPYTQLNSTAISGTSYVDTSVSAGQTYYYVATAAGQGSVQSGYSNQASAMVPSP